MSFIKELKGNSGCAVELHQAGSRYWIRKITRDPGYFSRFITQYHKHTNSSWPSPQIITPLVVNDEVCWYEMEFVVGTTYNLWLKKATIREAIDTFEQVLDLIECGIENDFVDHTNAVRDKVGSLYVPEGWESEPRSVRSRTSRFYHGDLTFENIIVHENGSLVFIDFLDTYLPSYFADCSKLETEILARWSFVNAGIDVARDIRFIFSELLGARWWYYEYAKHSPFLPVIDLLRTLPYAKSQSQRCRIMDAVMEMTCLHS